MGHPTGEEEKKILFQGIGVPYDRELRNPCDRELRNSWFIISSIPEKDVDQGIFETFPASGIESDLLEITSTFVGSSLYTIGGRVPNDFELSHTIRWLDTKNDSEGWRIGDLPSPCADPVIGVCDCFLYILPGVWKNGYYDMKEEAYLTSREGYIWNTKDECLKTSIHPPKVEGERRQWSRIRACADLDGRRLLIAMDGEKNFFLYSPETEDWEIRKFKDPLPKFIGETSFAASNGRLYILEVRGKSPPFLYIYDIKEMKLVMDEEPILEFDHDLWLMDERDRVVRIVPVADDKLCFLWLGPVSYVNEDMWPPVRILHHLKVKFSINPNPSNSEAKVEEYKRFHTIITKLLDCLPCDPEPFVAEAESRSPVDFQLDVFQKQLEDNASAEAIRTSLIAGDPFEDQAEGIGFLKEKGKGKRTQLEDPLSSHEQKRAKTMEESTFRYKATEEHPLKDCFYGIYYKNASGDDQELEHQCVIMNYKNDPNNNAISQIKLSRKMGDEYALEVLYINNRIEKSSEVEVIYPFFEKTMSEWLNQLKATRYQLRENMAYGEWMKTEVMPKIRKLWKLLFEMKDKNIRICMEENDPGYYMPLISGVPKLLNLQEGDNCDKNYVKSVLESIVNWGIALDLPQQFWSAFMFWNDEMRKKTNTLLGYWLCSKHPVLYDPVDKERFLLLMKNIIFGYGLKGWLNGKEKEFNWICFLGQINRAQNKDVYQQILHHKAKKSHGSDSKKGELEYSAGSDIVRFTKNALMSFEENYNKVSNNTSWHRGLDRKREIVEILDDELDVCSLLYAIARTIIAEDPPEKYTEEGWKKHQEKEWRKLKQQCSKAEAEAQAKEEAGEAQAKAQAVVAEVISQAYKPVQLQLMDMSNNWEEATKIIQDYQPLSLFIKNQPDHWMEATEIKAAYERKEESRLNALEFFTKENLRLDWMKFEDIKNKADHQSLELLTNGSGWMKVKEIFGHLKPLQLWVDRDNNWMEATDILKDPTPPRLYTKEGWKLRWLELKDIKNKANQPLQLHTRKAWNEVWKKLEDIKIEADQQLELCTGVSSWMKAIEISQVNPRQLSLWKREDSRKEESREGNWKKLIEIKSEANHPLELLMRVPCWMKAEEIFGVCQPLMNLWTKEDSREGWKEVEKDKNEVNQHLELLTKEDSRKCWKKFEEIKFEANQQLKLLTGESRWMKVKEISAAYPELRSLLMPNGSGKDQEREEKLKNEANQQLELWMKKNKVEEIKKDLNQLELLTMKEDWKQAEEIIKADQPPSLWVRKGRDEYYWMEAFEADRPAAEFLTKKNWLNARAELENFFNSLK